MFIDWSFDGGYLIARNAAGHNCRISVDSALCGHFMAAFLNSVPDLSRLVVPPYMLNENPEPA